MVTSVSKGGVGVPLDKNKSEIEAGCGKINAVAFDISVIRILHQEAHVQKKCFMVLFFS